MSENDYEVHECQSGGGFFCGLLTGALLGAAAMLLLAPKRGDEMRHDLVEGAGRIREKADDWKGCTEGLGARVTETAQGLKERGQHLVENAKERGAGVLGRVRPEADELAEDDEQLEDTESEITQASEETPESEQSA